MQSIYLTSAQKANQLPELDLPEVAFIGRSNCGKSSLVNALTNRRKLARTSSTPGRTQMANFFRLTMEGGAQLTLVDLPGYGYSVAARDIEGLWDRLLAAYLERSTLSCVCFLLDCRRKIEPFELAFITRMSASKPVLIILTKIDKVKRSEMTKFTRKLREQISEATDVCDIVGVSSLKKSGMPELLQRIHNMAQAMPPLSEVQPAAYMITPPKNKGLPRSTQ